MNSRRGFTLIESIVVITILALIAAVISPSMAGALKSRQYQAFVDGLKRLPLEARESAISKGRTCSIRYEESSRSLTLVVDALPDQSDSQEQTLKTVALADKVDAPRLFLDGNDSNSGEWVLKFYADGTSDSGGIEFRENSQAYGILVEGKSGSARFIDGELPEVTNDRWEAGELEQRI